MSREPEGNVSSILEAWRSQRFVTYGLPDWPNEEWSLLLVPEWRELAGKPLAEIATRQWIAANETILNDLAALPPDRWCAVSYEELVRDPQGTAEAVCAAHGLRWDQRVNGALPLSRYTLTPPAPEKWRQNEAVLAPFLPLTKSVAERARQTVRSAAPPKVAPTQPAKHEGVIINPAQEPVTRPIDFNSEHTGSFPELLDALGISIAVSTYQAGKVILLRTEDGVLNTHFRDFDSPMGLAYQDGRLAIGSKDQLWQFRNIPAAAPLVEPKGTHDALFLPGARYITGDIRIHEVAWAGTELWAVNTRFSCLCTFDGLHSFVPRWRPPFVSALTADDRCHLNGLAIVDGAPAYVTCHGQTDSTDGWRDGKADGGCLVEVHTGETIVRGLSMPHSPRFYDDRLWVLESGCGRVCVVDLETGNLQTVAELPGFTRGLDFFGDFAFVGLSQVRETAVFSGIPISTSDQERQCRVWVINIRTGQTVAFVRFSGSVQEIFAIQVLPGIRFPELICEDDALLGGTFLVPPEALTPEPARQLAPV